MECLSEMLIKGKKLVVNNGANLHTKGFVEYLKCEPLHLVTSVSFKYMPHHLVQMAHVIENRLITLLV